MANKKKILFVNPYFGEWKSIQSVAATNAPPLGLGYVATYVRDNTHAYVKLIDPVPMRMSEEDVILLAADYDLIALSCFTDIRFSCFDFVKKVKDTLPDLPVVVGGPHTFFLDEKILEHYPYVDIIVRGEGEQTLVDIINDMPLESIKGITYFDRNKSVIRNDDRELRPDIDDFYIDYENILPPLNLYGGDNEAPLELRGEPSAYLIESRGCPFSCSYCANDHWNRTWRGTSPEKIVEKIESIYSGTGVTHFRFYDDLFTANEKRVIEFCNLLQQKKLPVTFRVLVRAGTSVKVLKALKDAGCISVGFGIESGSDRILKQMNKKIRKDDVRKTIRECKNIGLWVVGSFIISFEGENEQDYHETLSLCPELDLIQTNIQIIFPYTPFYRQLKERGELDDEIWFDRKHDGRILYTKENFESAPWSYEELKWMALRTYYRYVLKNCKSAKAYYGWKGFLYQYVKAVLDFPFKGKLDHVWKVMRNSPT